LQTISFGDAISNDVLEIDKVLNEKGYESSIYAEFIRGKNTARFVRPINELNNHVKEEDVVIYHYCIGTELTYWFKNQNCTKILIYHNITPHEFFIKYSKDMTEITRYGRMGLYDLVGHVDYVIADSSYNKQELIDIGFKNVSVIPVLIDFLKYKSSPDGKVIRRYKDGKKNILFVGRLAPNKCQEDIILAFAYYRQNINPNSRLILVGSNAVPKYADDIRALPGRLDLDDVIFAGHVTQEELIGYYSVADVFLCMSEHEGFCVPLVESMLFDVPIIAFESSAISDTLKDSGIIFLKKDYARVGALLDIIMNQTDIRNKIIEKQKERLQYFSYDSVKQELLTFIEDVIAKKRSKQ